MLTVSPESVKPRAGERQATGSAAPRCAFAAMLVQMAISRGREYEADASGAHLCGRAAGLEHALEKLDVASRQEPLNATPATAHLFIVNPLTGGGLATLFSTHPPIEERIARLRAMKL